ncbi:OTU domain-containing protein 3 [Yarrowia sp. C11]|nr:OTU domain-containing protein 3 [Yarrowia sp. C11]KAG5365017.1 OTU domain-containing protein 3 [Yarrowia sp. E02]
MARKNRQTVLSGEFPLLKSIGLYATTIQGDGNCLFRSLADQLYGKDDLKMAMVIRQSVVDYMKKHSAYFEIFYSSEWDESWEAYIDRMSRSSVYGGNLELAAFASAYQLDVVVYQADLRYVITPIDESKGEKKVELEQDQGGERPEKVHIAYHTWEHYSSVRCINGPHSGSPEITSAYLSSYVPKGSDLIADASNDVGDWKVKQLRESLPFEVPDHLLAKVLKEHEDVGDAVDYFLENGIPEEENVEVSGGAEDGSRVPAAPSATEASQRSPKTTTETAPKEETKTERQKSTSTKTNPQSPVPLLDKKALRAQKAAERTAKREAKAREAAECTGNLKGGKKDKFRDKKDKQKARKNEKKAEANTIGNGSSADQNSTAESDYKVVMV